MKLDSEAVVSDGADFLADVDDAEIVFVSDVEAEEEGGLD